MMILLTRLEIRSGMTKKNIMKLRAETDRMTIKMRGLEVLT